MIAMKTTKTTKVTKTTKATTPNTLSIDGRCIGPDQPTFIVAEIGVNHDGSVERAIELVKIAKDAGADAIKLQVFRGQTLMHPSSCFADYQKDRCPEADPIAMLRRYELSREDLERIVPVARELGLIPLATPFSPCDVATLEQLDLPAIKIASPDLVNRVLLKRAIATGRPLIISTGAATMEEVQESAAWLRQMGAAFCLLHCISSYPTPSDCANLRWIDELHRTCKVPVGFSDHTTELLAGALAVASGACLIEKHLTYDRTAQGPDHSASADPQQFADYVRQIRLADQLRGTAGKCVLAIEQDVRTVSRQSLVLVRNMKAGQMIAEQDLTVQRPGTGVPAVCCAEVIGRTLIGDLPAGTMLQWPMLQAEQPLEAAA